MKELIKKIIISSKPINLFYVWVLRLLNGKSKDEFLRRRQLSIFDYKSVIAELPLYPTDLVIDNNFYGLSYWLQKYMRKNLALNAYIEHGLVLGSLVKQDAIKWNTANIITLSATRENYINNVTSKPVLKIGPYINYADDLLSADDFKKVKQSLGKTLIIFPSHSIKNIETAFNNDELINDIESKKQDFDTVLVCLYWRDALNEDLVASYVNKGYRIVSAGHVHDINFLSRLKSIIKLSDYAISNSAGTHIGYITFLGKPQMIIGQTIDYNINKNDNRAFDQRNNKDNDTMNAETEEILKVFSTDTATITDKQMEVVTKYWGLDELKSPQQIEDFITR
ncbi:MAG: hypothetical protein AB8B52_02930 [Winogradskyella sp.]|uniref:hypothetical protein n=1 Tax=Winogradskyella sp. TaxID=1883156 RepID=UPI00385E0579